MSPSLLNKQWAWQTLFLSKRSGNRMKKECFGHIMQGMSHSHNVQSAKADLQCAENLVQFIYRLCLLPKLS